MYATGRIVSVNVGLPREVAWKGQTVRTSIFKEPVEGPVPIRRLNLDGDRQSDLTVHGGPSKAVYVYPAEHYSAWRAELGRALPWGMFGENLTVEGLPLEGELSVGDRLRVGTAELVVTEPRLPCYKLGIRFGDDAFVGRFLESGRTGYYLAVEREGEVEAGSAVELLARHPSAVPVAEITRVFAGGSLDLDAVGRLAALEPLPEAWRGWFRKQLAADRAPRRRAPAADRAWAGYRRLVVLDRREETEDVVSFALGADDGSPLPPFLPGQYLTLRVPVPSEEAPSIRTYSLSDRHRGDGYRITVKRIREGRSGGPGVVSSWLHGELSVGDALEVAAPAGRFTLDPAESGRPVVLIAGGIGVTPLLSMLETLVAGGSERETWLFHGVRDGGGAIMRERLAQIERRYENVHVVFRESRARDGAAAGRVDAALLEETLPTLDCDYFVCGPPSMMTALTKALRERGVPDEQVRFEAFGPATVKRSSASGAEPPACGLEVTFAESGTVTLWSDCDAPLLELAEEHGIRIPFGCRAGSCGTCVTRVLSGEAEYLHRPNAPLAPGEILPCVAVPATALVLDA